MVPAMAWLSLSMLAFGLAMDATAVAAARGIASPVVQPRHALICGAWFGGFQALMPLVGALVGAAVGPWVEAWDHWIAFGLLTVLGLKMIREALADDDEPLGPADALFGAKAMLPLAIATSIDALAAGITLPLFPFPLLVSVAVIGGVTAALSAVGLYAGRRFGAMLGARLDVAGGVALILVGVKILVEHLMA